MNQSNNNERCAQCPMLLDKYVPNDSLQLMFKRSHSNDFQTQDFFKFILFQAPLCQVLGLESVGVCRGGLGTQRLYFKNNGQCKNDRDLQGSRAFFDTNGISNGSVEVCFRTRISLSEKTEQGLRKVGCRKVGEQGSREQEEQ